MPMILDEFDYAKILPMPKMRSTGVKGILNRQRESAFRKGVALMVQGRCNLLIQRYRIIGRIPLFYDHLAIKINTLV